jgi:hypothetical protein
VQRTNVGMLESGDGLRLAGETAKSVGSGLVQHLDGDDAVEAGVARLVHRTHTTTTEQGRDLVRAESRAGCQLHRIGRMDRR